MTNTDSLKGFWALIATQFQGAFSDMVYKTLLTLVAMSTAANAAQGSSRVSEINALFIIPFLLFSMYGGFLADRFSKRTVTTGTKLLEVGVMLLATLAAWMGSLDLGMAALFLLGTQAALFGPAKYGILPELLPEKRLSWGNGILEMTTFLSIILGTVVGGLLAEGLRGRLYVAGILLIGLALAGVVSSRGDHAGTASKSSGTFPFEFCQRHVPNHLHRPTGPCALAGSGGQRLLLVSGSADADQYSVLR